ncbi:hypothetical protein [Rhizobium sp. FKY42]|uniref:hypothetical protein n=1 Tax=Rhizobium sp. FKY42 TaxID=2562310 RepID=UPI0010C0D139|nr:hypothetical protein [Rhizobium sp. FKY42]
MTLEKHGAVVQPLRFRAGRNHLRLDALQTIAAHFDGTPLSLPGTVHSLLLGVPQTSFHAGIAIAKTDRVTVSFPEYQVSIESEFN